MSQTLQTPAPLPPGGGPIFAADASLTDHSVKLFAFDLARGIYPRDEIAVRWGFGTVANMRAWLFRHPEVVAFARQLQALNQADENVLDRIKHKSAHALESGLVDLYAIMSDPNASHKDKLDAGKLAARLAGADTVGKEQGPGGVSGTQFNLTIQFPNGYAESLSTTVVAPAEIEGVAEGDEADAPPAEDV